MTGVCCGPIAELTARLHRLAESMNEDVATRSRERLAALTGALAGRFHVCLIGATAVGKRTVVAALSRCANTVLPFPGQELLDAPVPSCFTGLPGLDSYFSTAVAATVASTAASAEETYQRSAGAVGLSAAVSVFVLSCQAFKSKDDEDALLSIHEKDRAEVGSPYSFNRCGIVLVAKHEPNSDGHPAADLLRDQALAFVRRVFPDFPPQRILVCSAADFLLGVCDASSRAASDKMQAKVRPRGAPLSAGELSEYQAKFRERSRFDEVPSLIARIGFAALLRDADLLEEAQRQWEVATAPVRVDPWLGQVLTVGGEHLIGHAMTGDGFGLRVRRLDPRGGGGSQLLLAIDAGEDILPGHFLQQLGTVPAQDIELSVRKDSPEYELLPSSWFGEGWYEALSSWDQGLAVAPGDVVYLVDPEHRKAAAEQIQGPHGAAVLKLKLLNLRPTRPMTVPMRLWRRSRTPCCKFQCDCEGLLEDTGRELLQAVSSHCPVEGCAQPLVQLCHKGQGERCLNAVCEQHACPQCDCGRAFHARAATNFTVVVPLLHVLALDSKLVNADVVMAPLQPCGPNWPDSALWEESFRVIVAQGTPSAGSLGRVILRTVGTPAGGGSVAPEAVARTIHRLEALIAAAIGVPVVQTRGRVVVVLEGPPSGAAGGPPAAGDCVAVDGEDELYSVEAVDPSGTVTASREGTRPVLALVSQLFPGHAKCAEWAQTLAEEFEIHTSADWSALLPPDLEYLKKRLTPVLVNRLESFMASTRLRRPLSSLCAVREEQRPNGVITCAPSHALGFKRDGQAYRGDFQDCPNRSLRLRIANDEQFLGSCLRKARSLRTDLVDRPHPLQRAVAVIEVLDPFAETVLRPLLPFVPKAIANYLTVRHKAAVKLLDDPSCVAFRGAGYAATAEIFSLECPREFSIAAQEVPNKGRFQGSLSEGMGQGYRLFPKGDDFLGPYSLHPMGTLVRVFLEPVRGSVTPGTWVVDEKTVVTSVEVRNAFRAVPDGTKWHRRYGQAWEIGNFVRDYARAEGGSTPPKAPLLPLDVRHNGELWQDAVKAEVAGCDIATAHRVLDHLFRTAWDMPGTGHLFKGLPGTGKTTIAERVVDALGQTYLPPAAANGDTKSREVEEAVKRNQHQVDIGRMIGNPYVGDSSAAFNALFDRGNGVCGIFVVNFDEVDLTASRDKENKEQVGKWLDRFTERNKPKGLHILSSTNNDRVIVGPIRSRYSGDRTVVVPVQSYSQHLATFRAERYRTHPYLKDSSNRAVTPETAARQCIGLAPRDVFVRDSSSTAQAKHEATGNVFGVGSQQSWTPVEMSTVRLETLGNSAQVLCDFLVAAAMPEPLTPPIVTGRIVALAASDALVVDVEVFPSDQRRTLRGAAHTHTIHPDQTTRCYELASLKELTVVLQQLAVRIDAHHYNCITKEFIDYVIGAVEAPDRDEKYSTAFDLIRAFCVRPCRSIIVLPVGHLGVSVDNSTVAPQLHLAAASVFDMHGLFAHGHLQFCVLVAGNDNEVQLIESKATPKFSKSPRMCLHTLSGGTFTCADCGRDECDANASGCFHEPAPATGRAYLTARTKRKVVKEVKDPRPYFLKQILDERSKDIVKVQIIGPNQSVVCEGPLIKYLSESQGCGCGHSHKDSPCSVFRQAKEEEDSVGPLSAASFHEVNVESVVALCTYRCGVNANDKHLFACTRRHTKPTLQAYYVAPAERKWFPCDKCDGSAENLCCWCCRLIPNPPRFNRLFYDGTSFYWCLGGYLRKFLSEGALMALTTCGSAAGAVHRATHFVRQRHSLDGEIYPICQPYPVGDPLPATTLLQLLTATNELVVQCGTVHYRGPLEEGLRLQLDRNALAPRSTAPVSYRLL